MNWGIEIHVQCPAVDSGSGNGHTDRQNQEPADFERTGGRTFLSACGIFLRNVSIPVILCYLLFLIHALGAGDIKLFSVIGGIWNLKILTVTIMISFLAAAAMSLGKMLYHRNLVSRLCIFGDYIRQTFAAAQFCQYPKSQGNQHIIHFSIAIFIGYIIAMEVAC